MASGDPARRERRRRLLLTEAMPNGASPPSTPSHPSRVSVEVLDSWAGRVFDTVESGWYRTALHPMPGDAVTSEGRVPLAPGDCIGSRYVVEGYVATGGMSVVFR